MSEKETKDNELLDRDEAQESQIYKDFTASQDYMRSHGYDAINKKCVDFYEGRQWPDATDKTRHLPRPVFNLVAMIVNNTMGNILATPTKLNYIAENENDATDKFTKFAEYQQKEMNQSKYDKKAVLDGLIKTNFVWLLYWDEFAIGKKGNAVGGVRIRNIDIMDLALENYEEDDVQKQKWIIYRSVEDVETVREMCEDKNLRSLIHPDDAKEDIGYGADYKIEGAKQVTIYTKFFRIKNEVYFEQATKNITLHKPKCMNPFTNERINELTKDIVDKKKEKKIVNEDEKVEEDENLYIDPKTASNQDTELSRDEIYDEDYQLQPKFHMYPIVIGKFTHRNKSIIGKSYIEDILEAQKAINFIMALSVLNVQKLGSPILLAKKDALKGQQVTNKVGEMLIDYTPPGQAGFQYLKTEPLSQSSLALPSQLIDIIRTVTNSSEVITGDMIARDLSGTAISQMINQQDKPISLARKSFWIAKEEEGKILEQFYKFYYEDKEFSYKLSDSEIQNEKNKGVDPKTINPFKKETFTGTDYIDKEFNIVVEAGPGTQYSELQQMSMLNQLLTMNLIDVKTYIQSYPDTAMANKSDLIRYLELKEQSELTIVTQQLQEALAQLQQISQYSKEQDKVINDLERRLDNANRTAGDLQKEYSSKINEANKFLLSVLQQSQTNKQKPIENKGNNVGQV